MLKGVPNPISSCFKINGIRLTLFTQRLRTGMVHLNGATVDPAAPFGGYKQSGVGREWGAAGIDEFLQTKAIMGSPTKVD